MSKVTVFCHVSVDGFFTGPQGEIDWFKSTPKDEEFETYTHEQSSGGGTLIFGRTTYEMMKSYWPTPAATNDDPEMADVIRNNPKIVFSKTLRSAEEGPNWKNVRVFPNIERGEVARLKEKEDVTILGSGSIVQQFANLGLIDRYQLIVVPIVLGAGKPLFKDVDQRNVKLRGARPFRTESRCSTTDAPEASKETRPPPAGERGRRQKRAREPPGD